MYPAIMEQAKEVMKARFAEKEYLQRVQSTIPVRLYTNKLEVWNVSRKKESKGEAASNATYTWGCRRQ